MGKPCPKCGSHLAFLVASDVNELLYPWAQCFACGHLFPADPRAIGKHRSAPRRPVWRLGAVLSGQGPAKAVRYPKETVTGEEHAR